MHKILTVVGARPQFIKAAVFSNSLATNSEFEEVIVHSGQHYDANMSDAFFSQLSIPRPYATFEAKGLSGAAFIGNTMMELDTVISSVAPDFVMVYGDTDTTLAAALCANKKGIKLIHVEAGLRSFNRNMPEEHNRVLTDHLSDALLCPSKIALANLENENITDSAARRVAFTGDIMFDGVQMFSKFADKPKDLTFEDGFILVTIHRPVNTDNQNLLANIVTELNQLAKSNRIVFPMHPRTSKALMNFNLTLDASINVIEPTSYFSMLYLLRECTAVVTDSGGLQKEAYFADKKCFVVRDETEWVELEAIGASILTGNGAFNLTDKIMREGIGSATNAEQDTAPYGNGQFVAKAIDVIKTLTE